MAGDPAALVDFQDRPVVQQLFGMTFPIGGVAGRVTTTLWGAKPYDETATCAIYVVSRKGAKAVFTRSCDDL